MKLQVWMAAVTQCFFSLTVSFGPIIYYSSFNNFRHNFHRDVWIVTTLDTFTSLLAGFTIFSILGNLAYELGIEDVSKVVQGGTGLAFISYPDAISKFDAVPQLFSVLFFTMLFTLGLGSAVSLTGSVITILSDMMPSIKGWIFTLIVFLYFIGLENLCKDIEFTIGVKVSAYWRICWAVLIPIFLPAILIYSFVNFQPLTYIGIPYPTSAIVCGWVLTAIGVLQIPIWAIIALKRSQEKTFHEVRKK
ncbi:hypothetical protein J437_LFUL007875 [Ladona fulva]|uniref:Sodium-dependent nutrient amino acid transporter 1 n=1 Tax=Ladona fulva TaxID=123851 RepID=A0A8K0P0D0_LADFU|nr:hypothetical protein J437_LFUL007875 [Ladona fulva]